MLDYCIVAGVSVLFLGGCLAYLSENDIFSIEDINKFQRLIYVSMFAIAIDCTFALLEGTKFNSFVLYLIKAVELTLNPVLAFLVFEIFYDRKASHKDTITLNRMRLIILLIITLNGILQITTIFKGYIFFLDSNNLYHRGSLISVYILLLSASVITLMYGMIIFSRKTQSTMRTTLLSFAAVLATGIIIRNFFPKKNYDFLCISVAIPFLLIYYSHITLSLDALTKLLNRQIYQRVIERVNYTTIIIMIDANYFKQINDSYGHRCGDKTLKHLARLIREAYGKYAYCFRIGGDEFCAILKPDVFDELVEETPYCDVYAMAENFMEKLNKLILEQTEADSEGSFLKYGVSQGYGIFYPETSYPTIDGKLSFKEVIELADKRMYEQKELFKKEQPPSN